MSEEHHEQSALDVAWVDVAWGALPPSADTSAELVYTRIASLPSEAAARSDTANGVGGSRERDCAGEGGSEGGVNGGSQGGEGRHLEGGRRTWREGVPSPLIRPTMSRAEKLAILARMDRGAPQPSARQARALGTARAHGCRPAAASGAQASEARATNTAAREGDGAGVREAGDEEAAAQTVTAAPGERLPQLIDGLAQRLGLSLEPLGMPTGMPARA